MTRQEYRSQTLPSHGNLRDGIQDLEYKRRLTAASAFGYLCTFPACPKLSSVFFMVLDSGRRKDSSRGMLNSAMIRFPLPEPMLMYGAVANRSAPPVTTTTWSFHPTVFDN